MCKTVIHIHTDYKFISSEQMFYGSYFSNTSVFIGDKSKNHEVNDHLLILNYKQDYQKLLDVCKNVDLVVLYDLDSIKVKLALSLPAHIKIAWRFFGYEIYHRRPDLFKSELSRKYDVPPIKKRIRKALSNIYQHFRLNNPDKEFRQALKRINYFLGLSEEEYNFLKQIWTELPQFIKIPPKPFDKSASDLNFQLKQVSKPLIILGNNRSSYNNHLDLINLIDKSENKNNFEFLLLFNYGKRNKYTEEVMRRTVDNNYYTIIDQFLNYRDFNSIYEKASGLVINGYRQMAAANIRVAIECGVKIYLNDKNVYKQFLENSGFKIFSIEDFEEDLKHNNLQFDKEVALYNLEILKRYTESYSYSDFQSDLLEQINTSEIRTKIDP